MEELPPNPGRLLCWASAAFNRKHYLLAAVLCRVKLIVNPDDYYTLCWYANSQYFLKNDQEADSLYRKAIRIDSSVSAAHAGLGRIHHGNALRIHREYSMLPDGSWVMFHDEADPEGFYSDDKVGLLSIGSYADQQCGNRRVAIYELEKAAELDHDVGDKVAMLLMAAQVYCIISNKDAIEAYKRVLRIDNGCIHAHFDLAGCYAATNRPRFARREYKFIKENAPELVSELEKALARFNVSVSA